MVLGTCRNLPLRVSRRTLGKEALDTGLEGTLEGLQIDEEVLLKRSRLEMGDEAKSATHSRAHALRARALCKRALLRRAGGSAHVRIFANARTHSPQRSPTHSRAHALRAHALCKRALLRHALTPAISSTSVPAPRRVGVRLAGARTRGDRRTAVQCLRFHSSGFERAFRCRGQIRNGVLPKRLFGLFSKISLLTLSVRTSSAAVTSRT